MNFEKNILPLQVVAPKPTTHLDTHHAANKLDNNLYFLLEPPSKQILGVA